MTKASLKRRRPLFLIAWLWVTQTCLWSCGSGDAGMDVHGARVVPAEQMALGMSKVAGARPRCASMFLSCRGSSPGAAAAVHLAHPAKERSSIVWDTLVGLRIPSSWPE